MVTEPLRFDGRVAVVTGAGGNPGLGRSYALLLAARGAKVVVNDLGVGPDGRGAISGSVESVVREITDAGGEAIGNGDSVATAAGARSIVADALDTWGQVDILVNNAGIAPFALFDEISETDVERVVDVHLLGHIWMCRAAWGPMKERGYGRLVNVSSGVAVTGMPYQSIYSAAKLGVVGLTRTLSAEGAPYGIKANVVMPAADTLAWQTMLEPEFSSAAVDAGLTPEAVAPTTAWLAHESIPYSGKIFQARGTMVNEYYFAATRGIAAEKTAASVESVAGRASGIVDRTRSTVVRDPSPRIPERMKPKPYSESRRG